MADQRANESSAEASDHVSGPQAAPKQASAGFDAQEAVLRAQACVKEAKRMYRRARRRAARSMREARHTAASDLIGHTLDLVKQHPGPSVVAALFLGFLLGRSSRR